MSPPFFNFDCNSSAWPQCVQQFVYAINLCGQWLSHKSHKQYRLCPAEAIRLTVIIELWTWLLSSLCNPFWDPTSSEPPLDFSVRTAHMHAHGHSVSEEVKSTSMRVNEWHYPFYYVCTCTYWDTLVKPMMWKNLMLFELSVTIDRCVIWWTIGTIDKRHMQFIGNEERERARERERDCAPLCACALESNPVHFTKASMAHTHTRTQRMLETKKRETAL